MSGVLSIEGSEGTKTFDLCKDKPYFLIGRHPKTDLSLMNKGVSRFHATIFKYCDRLWIIDHSQNGTFYNPLKKEFKDHTRLENSAASASFIGFKSGYLDVSSRADLLHSQDRKALPNLLDFVPGKFAEREDIDYILTMISHDEQAGFLCTCARRLSKQGFIGLPLLKSTGASDGYTILTVNVD